MVGELVQTIVPMTFTYKNRVGQYLERYIQGLGDKKLLGVRCRKCRRVLLPPREVCGRCNEVLKDWVEVKPEGTLEGFTVGYVNIEYGEFKEASERYVIGLIRLKNADSMLTALVKGIAPENLKRGLRVRAVWSEKPQGKLADLSHFEVFSEPAKVKAKRPSVKKKVPKGKKGGSRNG